MIWLIAKKEMLENLLSRRFRVAAVLCICAIVGSNFILLQDYEKRLDDYAINSPKQGEARALIRPSPLGLYASGLLKQMGGGYDFRPGTMIMYSAGTILNMDLISARFPVPDVAYLVRIVFSLLAMLLAYDTFCGEKAHGTLRMLLAQGASRSSIALGKVAGQLMAGGFPFTIAYLLGMLLVVLLARENISTEAVIRVLLFYAGSVVFLTIFTLIAMTISARTASPGTSLVASLFAWTVIVFAIPNLSGTVARSISPLPSADGLEEKKLLTYSLRGMWESQPGDGRPESITAEIRAMEHEYRNTLRRYIETTRKVSRFSPASAFVYLATAVTQTGIADEERMRDLVIQFRDEVLSQGEQAHEWNFAYVPLSLSESLDAVSVDVMLLLGCVIVLFSTTLLSLEYYDVR